MVGIENEKVQIGSPDPFSRAEMAALLNWLNDNLEGKDHFYYWYFELAFWCGCRPSEMLALRWRTSIGLIILCGLAKPCTRY